MEQSDEALIAGCRRGDEAAWEKLIHRYQRLIYSIPRRAGLDEDSAADVFQNVFAILVAKLDTIEQPDRIQAWLVTSARRETWRTISKQKAYAGPSLDRNNDDNNPIDPPDNAPLPEEEMLRLERQHGVRTAVDALDGRCRKLVELLFYAQESPSYSQIAAELGVPEGSIGPTRARCLKKLMRLLERVDL